MLEPYLFTTEFVMLKALAFSALLFVSACASGGDDRGWTGTGAQPFDSAQAACQIETQTTEGAQFEACMAGKGWTRPQP